MQVVLRIVPFDVQQAPDSFIGPFPASELRRAVWQ